MRTIKNRGKAERRLGGRLRPYFDHLETRMALSGSTFDTTPGSNVPALSGGTALGPNLSVVSTSPGGSAVLTTSPTDLFITFDRPIDSFSLGNADFDLVHVGSDGSTTPLGPGEASYSEALDPNDPTGSRIDLTLTKPLLAGHYGLLFDASSQLQGLDGSSMASTGSSTPFSQFTIIQPSTGLTGAVDLGTIGATATVHPDVLDLSNDPSQVRYYKITIAPGHHWRLGIEVDAQSIGSTLASTVSLFGANGRLIATGSVGLPGDPVDPYLFAGLDPGTYYVGVSASQNVPEASGTYDAGNVNLSSQTGGAYRIDLVADPADQPTRVLGVRVDHADPLSTNPTGLTLQFSGPIAVQGIQDPANSGLTLVDQSGKTWPITLIAYNANLGQLSLDFDQPLPSGTYNLQVSGTQGLVDLAGLHPIGTGLYPQSLASLTVVHQSAAAGDFGAILPGIARSGLVATVEADPAQPTVEQFVVVVPGVYDIGAQSSTSAITYSVEDSRGNILATGPGASGSASIHVVLQAGVYRLAVSTTGSTPTTIDVTIGRRETQYSSLLDAGVAQGPALNLRLVTPQANFGQFSIDSTFTSTNNPSPAVPSPQSSTGTTSDSVSGQLGATGMASSLGAGGDGGRRPEHPHRAFDLERAALRKRAGRPAFLDVESDQRRRPLGPFGPRRHRVLDDRDPDRAPGRPGRDRRGRDGRARSPRVSGGDQRGGARAGPRGGHDGVRPAGTVARKPARGRSNPREGRLDRSIRHECRGMGGDPELRFRPRPGPVPGRRLGADSVGRGFRPRAGTTDRVRVPHFAARRGSGDGRHRLSISSADPTAIEGPRQACVAIAGQVHPGRPSSPGEVPGPGLLSHTFNPSRSGPVESSTGPDLAFVSKSREISPASDGRVMEPFQPNRYGSPSPVNNQWGSASVTSMNRRIAWAGIVQPSS